ncbi:MAG: YajQ family cyclic di-GMP-binding protein [Gammaproteobacteria bacterium]|nr:YajQ family cyclic di-GMP-binding protein [Gammaproteobacteria bacterium]MBU1655334.1 YajQ family cyclic di-GMP-binding protein [Gammaproteobacteria bacterium]MBU1960987.1 YajQ family cyclic di-GMP-binding protein [Gammaproteobacteria bacterium]
MPSFDVVSEVDLQEIRNAVDQANREVGQRFDFKGSGAEYEVNGAEMTLRAQNDFQLRQMMDILEMKLVKRNLDIGCLEKKEPVVNLNDARQTVVARQGIESDTARKMVKEIKATKIKVQAQIQGEQVRVTGKNRDDLQEVIAFLRKADFGLPLQFTNFRD